MGAATSKVVSALNNQPREPLLGSNAKDVWEKKDDAVEFQLRQKAAQDRETNERRRVEEEAKLLDLGGVPHHRDGD
jgi:hypothetical protein